MFLVVDALFVLTEGTSYTTWMVAEGSVKLVTMRVFFIFVVRGGSGESDRFRSRNVNFSLFFELPINRDI